MVDVIIKSGVKPESQFMKTLISIDSDLNVNLEGEAADYIEADQIALLTEAIESINNLLTTMRYNYLHSNEPVDS